MGRLTLALPIVLMALAILAACSDGGPDVRALDTPKDGAPVITGTPTLVETATATPTFPLPAPTSPAPTSTPRVLSEPVRAAVDDLALRLSVSPNEIAVVSVTPQTWPDGCLGLAGPNEFCTQVITPGFEVVLAAGGVMYTYHTNQGSGVRLDES